MDTTVMEEKFINLDVQILKKHVGKLELILGVALTVISTSVLLV